MDLRLDYIRDGVWSLWDANICEAHTPGVNVVHVGCNPLRLVHYARTKLPRAPLSISPAVEILLELAKTKQVIWGNKWTANDW